MVFFPEYRMENDPVIAPEHRVPVPVAVLVGAGPGDPGLITMAGAAALADAAVVIYDALANPLLLSYCGSGVELIYVGKRANEHTLTQEQINNLLIQKCRDVLANRAKRPGVVVRLKGGDPYVFGRGGEEGQALAQAGIPFKVIPGITAGIAGPAYAGIPVTHRDFTSTVTFITGHQRDKQSGNAPPAEGEEEPVNVDYTALAKLGGTLVFYMGVKNLPEITQRLIAAGLDAKTPAAVVRMATHPDQQTVTGTVETIAFIARQAGIKAPAITIIGQVVSARPSLNWFESRPLFGQTILVTRTRQQASELGRRLEFLGAKVIESPTIEIVKPSDPAAALQAIRDMYEYDCVVFTSANGVRTTWEAMEVLNLDARDFAISVAVIGPGTADALISLGVRPDVVADDAIGEDLARELIAHFGAEPDTVNGSEEDGDVQDPELDLTGKRFLLLRAEIARPSLVRMLRSAGAEVDDVPVYQTRLPDALPAEAIEALRSGTVGWITFTSASTAENLHAMLPEDLRAAVKKCNRLSIGPVTSKAMSELGWPPTIEAHHHDIPGMVEALLMARSRT
jgi:uroporphyrinogen III methyltransferase/synthase